MSPDEPTIPFTIEIDADVLPFLAAAKQIDVEFEWRWQSIIDLLEIAGHSIGRPVAGGPLARFELFKLGEWGIIVVWQFQKNVVRIRGAKFPKNL